MLHCNIKFNNVHILPHSNCEQYCAYISNKKCTCDSSTAWLQSAWIKTCFASLPPAVDVYVRVRPDSYFTSIPNIQIKENDIISWEKYDPEFSDQFFLMGKKAYMSWFRYFTPTNGLLEYDPQWKQMGATQNVDIMGCLVTWNDVSCWSRNFTKTRIILKDYLSKNRTCLSRASESMPGQLRSSEEQALKFRSRPSPPS